ncbi:hypothetical protein E0H26_02590 [Micromonospora zingiberis]|uniref:Uncharacterized protein n=1 Tax=Micromonospora zingiberis TaxID=2053011 RepID=A0A4R0GSB4_9ACTN|nr:hypothetical protein [Micromonospora zingiberis]TCC00587.1 hypothetical protein E0H26_02590 [Micromonospora zingiberis]
MALINVSLLDGNPSDLYSLVDWLQRTDDLHGRVRMVPRQPGPEDMGSAMETLSVALGSGGLGAVLAGALSTWLGTRRARISVEFVESDTGETIRKVEVEATNAKSVKDMYALLAPGRTVP